MHYVYLLESAFDHRRHYTGRTGDLKARLAAHNAGQNPSTASGRPWNLIGYLAFADENRAAAFERYLKSGSGMTFAKRAFLVNPDAVMQIGQQRRTLSNECASAKKNLFGRIAAKLAFIVVTEPS